VAKIAKGPLIHRQPPHPKRSDRRVFWVYSIGNGRNESKTAETAVVFRVFGLKSCQKGPFSRAKTVVGSPLQELSGDCEKKLALKKKFVV
jgi:hypothetical protein